MASFNAEQKTAPNTQAAVQICVATQIQFGSRVYYMLQASCTTAASGYVTWVNATGDNTGRPTCAGVLGDTVIVKTWLA